MIIRSNRCKTACSGIRDCTNTVAFAGSMPAASQSINNSRDEFSDPAGIGIVRRECVPVRDKEIALELVLKAFPILQGAEIVAEMEQPARLHAAENTLSGCGHWGSVSCSETDGRGENRIREAVGQGACDGMDQVDLWVESDQRHQDEHAVGLHAHERRRRNGLGVGS